MTKLIHLLEKTSTNQCIANSYLTREKDNKTTIPLRWKSEVQF